MYLLIDILELHPGVQYLLDQIYPSLIVDFCLFQYNSPYSLIVSETDVVS